jgi:hypothetical protein
MSTKKQTINELANHQSLLDPKIQQNLRGETLDQWKNRLINTLAAVDERVSSMERRNNSNLNY